MSALTALGLMIGLTVVLTLAGFWAQAHLVRRQKYRLHRDEFFSLARDLIRAEDCPIELAVVLRHVGATMNKMVVLALLVCGAITGGRFPRYNVEALIALIKSCPDHIRIKLTEARHQAVLAVSYRSLVFGPLIRWHSCGDHNRDGVDAAVIGEVVRYGERHEMPKYLETALETAIGRLSL